MTVFKYKKDIITDIDSISERSDEINVKKDIKKVRKIVKELKDTLLSNPELSSLSAPQIGHDVRMFAINFQGDVRVFINPVITRTKGFTVSREKDASIPGKEFIMPRNEELICMYQTPTGKPEANRFKGVASYLFQQEVDHLNGVFASDYGLEVLEGFDQASDEEKNQIIQLYIDSLSNEKKLLEEEIKSDKDLAQIAGAIDFMEKVGSGEVTLATAEE